MGVPQLNKKDDGHVEPVIEAALLIRIMMIMVILLLRLAVALTFVRLSSISSNSILVACLSAAIVLVGSCSMTFSVAFTSKRTAVVAVLSTKGVV